jgi:murein L,D-transpeptidase YcbB/YkuD
MRPSRGAIGWLPWLLLTACAASPSGERTAVRSAVRGFQARYGLTVSGLLDRETREELKLGVDPKRTG